MRQIVTGNGVGALFAPSGAYLPFGEPTSALSTITRFRWQIVLQFVTCTAAGPARAFESNTDDALSSAMNYTLVR